jgi:hypothetical protein
MLIRSDFHDYYDSALGITGVDSDIIYRRFTHTIADADPPEGWFDAPNQRRFFGRVTGYYPLFSRVAGYSLVREFIVGFCGEAWYGIEISRSGETKHNPFKNIFVYDDDIGTFIAEYITPPHLMYEEGGSYNRFLDLRHRLGKYQDSGAISRLHRSHNVPVFVYIMGGSLILNPQLQEFGFMKVKETFSAFQDLQSYVGGVLQAEAPEILDISDLDRLKQHGFDEKWSFRNPNPPNRKQHKREK